ncbi:hypothetical protein E8L90_29730 [Brevibacillus antibioticus]|uniref:Uncharacterized protein n=1 Tax=Brevibacillus antibioticus TaxID=2570228 RepID=A0A4U2XYE3_9BACL|nr:hypothetical protein [Brevibacillus antibioticus]TKI52938.1 hypothetical protein E8L90_29730 [Brevibacillus antibioticus]
MSKKTKRLTPKQQETKKNEAWFKRHTTLFLKNNPKASANEIERTFRQKGGKIGHAKAKDIVRDKKNRSLDVSKRTGKIKHHEVSKKDKRKYKAPYTYVMGYRLVSDPPNAEARHITIVRNDKASRSDLINEVVSALASFDMKQQQYYGYVKDGIREVFLLHAYRNTGKAGIPVIYA